MVVPLAECIQCAAGVLRFTNLGGVFGYNWAISPLQRWLTKAQSSWRAGQNAANAGLVGDLECQGCSSRLVASQKVRLPHATPTMADDHVSQKFSLLFYQTEDALCLTFGGCEVKSTDASVLYKLHILNCQSTRQ